MEAQADANGNSDSKQYVCFFYPQYFLNITCHNLEIHKVICTSGCFFLLIFYLCSYTFCNFIYRKQWDLSPQKRLTWKFSSICSLLQFSKAICCFFWHNCVSKLKKEKRWHSTCPLYYWNCAGRVQPHHRTYWSKICLRRLTYLQQVTKWDFHHELSHLTV